MRVPLSWLREYADLPEHVTATEVAARLTALGLKLESVTAHGAELKGPLVVGRVQSFDTETHSNGKSIRWCSVDVGPEHAAEGGDSRGIVCGAANFTAGDLVVVALPGAVLPGMSIGARETYGHVSDGMICSAHELDLGDDASGVIVLPDTTAEPGADAIPLLHLLDEVIELEITPDRSYALSLRGVAREAATGFGVAFHDPAAIPVTPGEGPSYPVEVEDEHDCPVFVTRTVSGFDPAAPTPRWLARRIQLAGMRPISLAVDITNYVMLELGQPIHGYDRAMLSGAISVRRALPGEELRTLDGSQRRLIPEDLVIADGSGAIGLAGVMGGEATEISATTTDVVIEAAHFAGVPIARTAQRLRLASEASRRFERGVDPLLVRAAAQRVADLLVEHGGGRTEPGQTVCGSVHARPPIVLPVELPTRVCGVDIDADTVASCLRQVGCKVGSHQEGKLAVTSPSWRPDLVDPYDLVEEVLRIVGYDRVPSVLPTAPAGRGLTRSQQLRRRVGTVLAGAGFAEVVAYPFVGPADWDRLGLDADDERRRCLRLANPLSEQRPELTTSLAPLLLEVLARNVGRGQSSAALSLTAPVFVPDVGPLRPAPILPVDKAPEPAQLAALDAAVPRQPRRLAVILSSDRELAGWWGEARPVLSADAVAAVRLVAGALGVDIDIERGALMPWHPGRCGRIQLAGSLIGHAGELHPRVCRAWDVPLRTAYAEVDLDQLIAAAPLRPGLPTLSAMPVAKEDVALIVANEVPAAQVQEALRAGAGSLLESLRLFDVYTGDPVPSGKKSLAFSLRFRAPDRTLTEREIAAARDTAVAAAAAATGAVQRTQRLETDATPLPAR